MQTAPYPEVPPDFGHWLAGFIDGEGSFYIARYTHAQGYGYQMRFALKLRDDDRAGLRRCAEMTGIGYVQLYARRRPWPGREGAKAQAEWLVVTKADCARLVEILDRYPLRSKKARDFAIWREAVLLHAQLRVRSSPSGGRAPHDWGQIAELWQQLPAVRAYEFAAGRDSGAEQLGAD